MLKSAYAPHKIRHFQKKLAVVSYCWLYLRCPLHGNLWPWPPLAQWRWLFLLNINYLWRCWLILWSWSRWLAYSRQVFSSKCKSFFASLPTAQCRNVYFAYHSDLHPTFNYCRYILESRCAILCNQSSSRKTYQNKIQKRSSITLYWLCFLPPL